MSLQEQADAVFSTLIRQKAADEHGIVKCYTCDHWALWSFLYAGHFITRGHLAVRYDPMNVKPNCYECNGPLNGNVKVFEKNLIAEHGADAVAFLHQHKHDYCGWRDADYRKMIKGWQAELKLL